MMEGRWAGGYQQQARSQESRRLCSSGTRWHPRSRGARVIQWVRATWWWQLSETHRDTGHGPEPGVTTCPKGAASVPKLWQCLGLRPGPHARPAPPNFCFQGVASLDLRP